MKKTLLLQTAMVAAAGLMASTGAFAAETKEVPIGVSVGGYMERAWGFQDRGKAQTDQPANTFLSPDAEIWFNIRGVLDNGVVVGGRVELEGSTESDQIDESYLFVERSDIGRAEIGSTDLVANKMLYGAPTAIPGSSTNVSDNITPVYNLYSLWFQNAGNDNEHINLYTSSNRYFGSKVGKGLQLGFSYVPNGCQDRTGTNACNSLTSSANSSTVVNAQNTYAFAANYLESFGPVDVALFGAYLSDRPAGTGDRLHGWQSGAQFAYNIGDGSQVQFGGLYTAEEITAQNGRKGYGLGLKYLTNAKKPGSVGVGVEYGHGHYIPSSNVGTDVDTYMLGVTYQVAQGILTFAGVGKNDVDAIGTSTGDNKQTFGTMGVRLDF